MRVVKKPIVFEAVKFDGNLTKLLEAFPEIHQVVELDDDNKEHYYLLRRDDYDVEFYVGDIIIKDIDVGYYPVRPDVFTKTYDIVE